MSATTKSESKQIDQPDQKNQVIQNTSQQQNIRIFVERFNLALDKNNFPALHNGRLRAIASRFGVSLSAARKWATGDCYPDVERLIMICNELGTTIDFLVGRTPLFSQETGIPVISGEPNLVSTDSKSLGIISFEKDVLQSTMRLPLNGSKLFLVKTDSMEPVINVGDIAFLDTSATRLADGSICMFAARDRILLRRVSIGLDDQITLSCSNSIYPAQCISIDEIQIGDGDNHNAKLRLIATIQWTIKKVSGGM
jgi:transcriptional regulator with XRE-family HTH domain